MRILAKITTVAAILLLLAGCEESQLEQVDPIVTDANNIVTALRDMLQSPAGAFVPPDIRLYGAIGLALASIGVNSWQKVRSVLMKKTTKAIVRGIEKGQGDPKPNPTDKIKAAIAKEMRTARIYDKGNKIVDRLKIA